MILRYDDGTKVRDFEFHPGKLLSPEAEAIEDVGGSAWDTFDEWGAKFLKGNRRAYRAGLWIMLRREQPGLKFTDLTVTADAVTWDFDPEEREQVIEAIREQGADADEEQRAVLDSLLAEYPGKSPAGASDSSGETTDSESANSSTAD